MTKEQAAYWQDKLKDVGVSSSIEPTNIYYLQLADGRRIETRNAASGFIVTKLDEMISSSTKLTKAGRDGINSDPGDYYARITAIQFGNRTVDQVIESLNKRAS